MRTIDLLEEGGELIARWIWHWLGTGVGSGIHNSSCVDGLGEHRLLPLWPWLLACHGSKMDTDGAYFFAGINLLCLLCFVCFSFVFLNCVMCFCFLLLVFYVLCSSVIVVFVFVVCRLFFHLVFLVVFSVSLFVLCCWWSLFCCLLILCCLCLLCFVCVSFVFLSWVLCLSVCFLVFFVFCVCLFFLKSFRPCSKWVQKRP